MDIELTYGIKDLDLRKCYELTNKFYFSKEKDFLFILNETLEKANVHETFLIKALVEYYEYLMSLDK